MNPSNSPQVQTYTTAQAMTEALLHFGVEYVFVNLGTDHPALIEAWAGMKKDGRPLPQIIVCPHETVALSAALGYAQVTGRPQAVVVHVDVGTQNLGGAVHNAARGRVPVLIFAGASSYTLENELPGSRTDYIQFIQDVYDQRGIVREYTKWNYEIRTGKNIKQLITRALQISSSDPKGPVYLMGAREVLEEKALDVDIELGQWGSIHPAALRSEDVQEIASALLAAKKPLFITTYAGRDSEAVAQLVHLSERLAIPLIEISPSVVNFPTNHPNHLGFGQELELLESADVILVVDCDVPWVPAQGGPNKSARTFYIDVDPLKQDLPLWYSPSEGFYQVNAGEALAQLNEELDHTVINETEVAIRRQQNADYHANLRAKWNEDSNLTREDAITPEFLTACLSSVISDDTVVVNETAANSRVISRYLHRSKPGTMFTSGASSLGWGSGAAIGVKLANPDKDVVLVTGDGSYMFGVPTAAHWVAKKYETPFMTVIYNNSGWNAPKQATLRVHPNGISAQNDDFWVSFSPSAQLDKVAEAAGNALAITVEHPQELAGALEAGLRAVREGRSAVINVILPHASYQEIPS